MLEQRVNIAIHLKNIIQMLCKEKKKNPSSDGADICHVIFHSNHYIT